MFDDNGALNLGVVEQKKLEQYMEKVDVVRLEMGLLVVDLSVESMKQKMMMDN